MDREFREMQRHLDNLHKLRKEMMEVFRLPMLFQKKKKGSGILAVKPRKK